MTRIPKAWDEAESLPLYIPDKSYFSQGKRDTAHLKNPGTEYLSGEISKDVRITATAGNGMLSGLVPKHHRNIFSYCYLLRLLWSYHLLGV